MAIRMRRGADADFDPSKMLGGELAVTTDGTRKAYVTFAPNDAHEIITDENLDDKCEDILDEMVRVSPSEPTSNMNRVWISDEEEEFEVPTMDDLDDTISEHIESLVTNQTITPVSSSSYVLYIGCYKIGKVVFVYGTIKINATVYAGAIIAKNLPTPKFSIIHTKAESYVNGTSASVLLELNGSSLYLRNPMSKDKTYSFSFFYFVN